MSEPVASRPTPDWLGSDELLPWSWAVERLEAERNFWLVSVHRDGFPQARPVWGAWSGDELGWYLQQIAAGRFREDPGRTSEFWDELGNRRSRTDPSGSPDTPSEWQPWEHR